MVYSIYHRIQTLQKSHKLSQDINVSKQYLKGKSIYIFLFQESVRRGILNLVPTEISWFGLGLVYCSNKRLCSRKQGKNCHASTTLAPRRIKDLSVQRHFSKFSTVVTRAVYKLESHRRLRFDDEGTLTQRSVLEICTGIAFASQGINFYLIL